MTLVDIIETFLSEIGIKNSSLVARIKTQRGNYFNAPVWIWIDPDKNQFGLRTDEEDIKIWNAADPNSIGEFNSFITNKKLRINQHNKYEIDDE